MCELAKADAAEPELAVHGARAPAAPAARVAAGLVLRRAARPQRFKTRKYSRCNRCGRPRAVFKKFGLCRICLRELAHQGVIPGMTKSSW